MVDLMTVPVNYFSNLGTNQRTNKSKHRSTEYCRCNPSKMGGRGKFVLRRSRKRRLLSTKEGSDNSDEDFVLEEDEENSTSDRSECASSSAGEELGETFDFEEAMSGSSREDEEERKVIGLRPHMVLRDQRNESIKHGVDFVDEDENFQVGMRVTRKKHLVWKLNPIEGSSNCIKFLGKRTRASVNFDDGTGDYDDDDEEEFTPDGVDFAANDEDFQVREKTNTTKRLVRKRVSLEGPKMKMKRKRKSKAAKKPLRKKRRRSKRKSVLRRLVSSDDDFLVEIPENRTVMEKTKKKTGKRNKSSILYLDSDIECSGSLDFECTISEEEREELREANIFCGNLTTCLRSSSLLKRLHVDGTSNHHQKTKAGQKGKEKVEDLQIDAGKQVCGICLNEKGKGTVQGTLNCCNHYFCFACILEWSRVESRCPLCKQRFATISKPARSSLGIDLRSVVMQVPKRDRVYRPSEEEVGGYFDPYENVVCMECHQGGDDNIMLLCDICDSPAHIYCVGLGWEVPEGNWYCEDPVFNQMTVHSNLTAGLSTGEINVESSDCTYQTVSLQGLSVSPGIGVVPSPRDALGGDFQATSTVTGAGASILTDGASQVNFGSGFGNCNFERGGETTHQNELISRSVRSCVAVVGCMAQDSSCPTQEEDAFGASFGHLGRHINEGPSTATLSVSSCVNAIRSWESPLVCKVKQHLQSIVRDHLKRLSQHTQVDRWTFKDIARHSTHTVLDACRPDYNRSVAIPVQPPSRCPHVERLSESINQMEKCCSSCFNSFGHFGLDCDFRWTSWHKPQPTKCNYRKPCFSEGGLYGQFRLLNLMWQMKRVIYQTNGLEGPHGVSTCLNNSSRVIWLSKKGVAHFFAVKLAYSIDIKKKQPRTRFISVGDTVFNIMSKCKGRGSMT
ncbi:hypothetical protein NE237_015666 [Protea cynaroides]|uniref:RING-type domain-containing protein n=1 Tax=Protea cynaroides TaxID=273540 RepID=A0A9Q0QR56_9MAGN|nr:hypothetical protein NE237_015666 [Protea cynaroides]